MHQHNKHMLLDNCTQPITPRHVITASSKLTIIPSTIHSNDTITPPPKSESPNSTVCSSSSSTSTSYKLTQQQHSRLKPAPTMKPNLKEPPRKLTIFSTRNMKALLTTDDLDPVMARIGFTSALPHPHPPSSPAADHTFMGWREYLFNGKWAKVKSLDDPLPVAALPYPRIDGLHESIYAEFIKAVEFYLRRNNVTDILHIRGLLLDRFLDRGMPWRSMDNGVHKYREVPMLESRNQQGVKNLGKDGNVEQSALNGSNRIPSRDEDNSDAGRFVEFSDIVKSSGGWGI